MNEPRKKTGRKKPQLSVQQKLFVANLLRGMSGGRAAIAAGYTAKDPYVCANGLLRNPKIRAARDEGLAALRVSPEEVVAETGYIATAHPKDLVDAKGKLLPVHKWPEGLARSVASVKQFPDGSIEFRFWSKTEALNLMGKYHKLFVDRREVTGKDGSALIPIESLREVLGVEE